MLESHGKQKNDKSQSYKNKAYLLVGYNRRRKWIGRCHNAFPNIEGLFAHTSHIILHLWHLTRKSSCSLNKETIHIDICKTLSHWLGSPSIWTIASMWPSSYSLQCECLIITMIQYFALHHIDEAFHTPLRQSNPDKRILHGHNINQWWHWF